MGKCMNTRTRRPLTRGLTICTILFTLALPAWANLSLSSPDGQLQAVISISAESGLQYIVTRDGGRVWNESPLGLTVDSIDLGTAVTSISAGPVTEQYRTYPYRGAKATAVDHYNMMILTVNRGGAGDAQFLMEWRAYDDGIAYRYQIPGSGTRNLTSENSCFAAPPGASVWSHSSINNSYYEGVFQKLYPPFWTFITTPATFELPATNGYAGGYAVIMEADLDNYGGMILQPVNDLYTFKSYIYAGTFQRQSGTWTPWRITLTTDSLNEMVNSTIVSNLAPDPAPELENASWIRPGKSLWSWWWRETRYEDQVPYIDYAAALGFDYVLWDEDWEYWSTSQLDYLLNYARNKGIDVWVWKRWTTLDTQQERDVFFGWIDTKNAAIGEKILVGVKIDFMNSETPAVINWYHDTLQDAADHQLMINFHGANKPTGMERTYPHEMTREGIRGLEYHGWGDYLPPSHNAMIPFTRGLAGHTDYTPVTFWDDRMGNTSAAHQLAMAFVLVSPLTHWADRPEHYINSVARDVIEAAPTTWDETVVLDQSQLGELTAIARRKGSQWFLAILNGSSTTSKNINIDMNFLNSWLPFDAVLLADSTASQYSFSRTDTTISRDDNLSIWLRSGGGFVAMFTGETIEVPDFDQDGDVDQSDFGHFQSCYTGQDQGPPSAGCENAKLDTDNDVDIYDLTYFKNCMSGPSVPYDPNCMNEPVTGLVPDTAMAMDPLDEQTDVSRNVVLDWTPGTAAESHDLYFGTSNPPPFHSSLGTSQFDPGTLQAETTYYWRVDEVNSEGTTTGTVWSFTTEPLPLVLNLNRYATGNLDVGAQYYQDRDYVILGMPAHLQGQIGIRTNNDDKSATSLSWIGFSLSRPADVYIAYDRRGTPQDGGTLPTWLSSAYTDTGSFVTVDDEASPMRLYKKSFTAGSAVSLGGNMASPASGAGSNYFVLIDEIGD